MKKILIPLSLIALSSLHAAPDLSRSLALTFSDGQETLPYRLFLPEGWEDAGKEFPLVLFLHGDGERGTDNLTHVSKYIDGLIEATSSGVDAAFVLAPQAPGGGLSKQFVATPYSTGVAENQPAITSTMDLTLQLLDKVIMDYPVDSKRVSVTGLSMGGYGALDAVFRRPGFFAAAVPLSGGGAADTVPVLANSPTQIWFFHGENDPIVPVSAPRQLVAALSDAGKYARYTELPDRRHIIWDDVYSGTVAPGFYQWLLTRTLPESDQAIEAEVERLLALMTTEEKVAQMMMVREDFVEPSDLQANGYGAILVRPTPAARPGVENATDWADRYDERVQASLDSRLGIPLLVGVDAVHGHALAQGATVFPHNVGLGSVWESELLRRMGEAVADEIRATGCNWILAPAVSVTRDIRWGRTYEGWGERPETQTDKVAHFIEGVQTGGRRPVIATAKHFLGDGGPLWGTSPKGPRNIDQGDARISEEELRELHLPPFIEAIEADVGSIMVGYHQWNGVEAHHSYYLLTTMLKEELGFDGFIVSDATGFYEEGQDFSERSLSAALSGIDLFMLTNTSLWPEFHPAMMNHIANNDLPMARVDDAVRRILRVKLRNGLFEFPLADRTLTDAGALGAESHREISRELVQQSIVLLRNDNDVLPLSKQSRVGVAGPLANDVGPMCGGWTYRWAGVSGSASAVLNGVSILDGIRNAVEPAGGSVYFDTSGAQLPEDLDAIFYVLGELPYAEWFGDSINPAISSANLARINSLRKEFKVPVIVIVVSARPLLAGRAPLLWDGLIFAGLPGTEGGSGIADCIFGDAPFDAKITHSWPAVASDLPSNLDTEGYDPVFPFGFGLSTLEETLPAVLPTGYADEPFAFDLASGAWENAQWSVVLGTLPEGIQLSSDGRFSGSSVQSGNHAFQVEARNSNGETIRHSYLLRILPIESYAAWAAAITWPEGADSTPHGNPDNDNLPNFLEYLSGRNPLIAEDSTRLQIETVSTGANTALKMTLPLRNAAFAEAAKVQFSGNLLNWYPIESEVIQQNGNPYLHVRTLPVRNIAPFLLYVSPQQ